MMRYSGPNRIDWGPGAWNNEPDYGTWLGLGELPCMILRADFGNLCGYVGVPPDHPWHATEDQPDVEVHGRLVWRSVAGEWYLWLPKQQDASESGFRAALEGDPNDNTTRLVYADWLDEHDRHREAYILRQAREFVWFGFHCSAEFDYSPGCGLLEYLMGDGVVKYRDWTYVTAEVDRLAAQVSCARIDG